MTKSDREIAEARARNGHLVITALRFGGIAMIMLGFAVVRGVVDWPYAVGVVLVVAGFLDFFFVPRVVARAWKARDGDGR